jgi:geranylgeranyl diphosphate synthase, type III
MSVLPRRQQNTPSHASSSSDRAQVVSALLTENLQSPNAIPPRTSSSGVVTNGASPPSRAVKKASSSVLRPISETDWLSQGKRISLEALGRLRHSMGSPSRGSRTAFDPVDTVPGASKDVDRSAVMYQDASPPKPHKRFEMAEPLPLRTSSSRHRFSSSLESRTSSKATKEQRSLSSPPPPDKQFIEDLIHQRQRTWPADKERILLAPYNYLYGHPGKDIRAQLIAAFNEWLNVPEPSLAIITKVVGMLHTASLLCAPLQIS